MNTKYDVFISYSRKDFEYWGNSAESDCPVSVILHALQNAGISYWYDQEGIEYGDNFVEKILEHIEFAPIFIFLSSKYSNESRFTSREVAIADELRKFIIPVKLDSTPYGENIMFRIVDIPPVRYDKNADKALRELTTRIHIHLDEIKIEEQKKEDEIRRQHEAEEAELLKEKTRRERKAQLDRLNEQHDKAIKDLEVAGNVVAECLSQLKKAKKALEAKENDVKEEKLKLSKLTETLDGILCQKEDSMEGKKISIVPSKEEKEKNKKFNEEVCEKQKKNEKEPKEDLILAKGNEETKTSRHVLKDDKSLMYYIHKLVLRKWSIGFLFSACLLGIFMWIKGCSEKSENVASKSVYFVDSISSNKETVLDRTIDEILSNLSKVRPQFREYVEGYKKHDVKATFMLAKCFEEGDFLEGNRNLNIAGKLYHIAANAGFADAQTSLGLYFFKGRGGFVLNYDSAVYWYSEAIRNGSIAAKYHLALAYDDGRYTGTKQGKSKNSKAMELYRSSAESGFVKSQVVLGFYYYGVGDYLESKKWLEKALKTDSGLSNQEKAMAEFYMGQLYGTGKLTIALHLRKEEIDKISFEWYQKAATTGEGYKEAMYYLGLYYQEAKGTKQDLVKATEWFRKAANRGHQGAIEKLSGKNKKKSVIGRKKR